MAPQERPSARVRPGLPPGVRHDERADRGRMPAAEGGADVIGTRGTTEPADLTDVRATNLAVVLRFVRTHAPCSRADIAASTGLNKATVSSLVTDLLERGLLLETGVAGNRIGRPATMLTLHSEPYAAIGIEVAADRLAAIAIDLTGE